MCLLDFALKSRWIIFTSALKFDLEYNHEMGLPDLNCFCISALKVESYYVKVRLFTRIGCTRFVKNLYLNITFMKI